MIEILHLLQSMGVLEIAGVILSCCLADFNLFKYDKKFIGCWTTPHIITVWRLAFPDKNDDHLKLERMLLRYFLPYSYSYRIKQDVYSSELNILN